MTKLLGISGALRKASTNTQLLQNAADIFGGDYTQADLQLPLYDGDVEAAGIPASVQTLADQIAADAGKLTNERYIAALTDLMAELKSRI